MKKFRVIIFSLILTHQSAFAGLPVIDPTHILNTIINEIGRAADFALDQIEQANQLKELVTQSNELIDQTGLLGDIKGVYGNAKHVWYKLGRVNDELQYLHDDVLQLYGGFMGDQDQAIYDKIFGYLDSGNHVYAPPEDIYAPEKEYRSRTVEVTGTIGEELTEYRRNLEQEIRDTAELLSNAQTDQEIQKHGKKLDALTAMLIATQAEEAKAFQRAMITNTSAQVSQREMQKARDQKNLELNTNSKQAEGKAIDEMSKEFASIREGMAADAK